MKILQIGLRTKIERPKGSFLWIDGEVEHPKGRIFDPLKNHFNPLKNLNYRKSCEIVEIFDALFTRGDSTLTKDTGLDFLHDCLEKKPESFDTLVPEPDKKSSTGHIWAYSKVKRLMRSPVLGSVFCEGNEFSFKGKNTKIIARLDRGVLGDFDALALGLFLTAHYKGTVCIPAGEFYLRNLHVALIREDRLIVGVRRLKDLPEAFDVMDFDERIPQGATFKDAEELAECEGLRRIFDKEDSDFNKYVDAAMA